MINDKVCWFSVKYLHLYYYFLATSSTLSWPSNYMLVYIALSSPLTIFAIFDCVSLFFPGRVTRLVNGRDGELDSVYEVLYENCGGIPTHTDNLVEDYLGANLYFVDTNTGACTW